MAIDWNEVGAVATGGAAVVALFGVGITTWLTRRQLRQDRDQFAQDGYNREAAAVRAALHEFEGVARGVCAQIRDGAAVVSMSWLTAEALIDLARQDADDDNAAKDRLRALVLSGDSLLSLWIRASENSPAAVSLFNEAPTLPELGSKIRGEFSMTSYLGDMIFTIVNDIKIILIQSLLAVDHEDIGSRRRQRIVSQYLQGDTWSELQVGLARALRESLAPYVMDRYFQTTITIDNIMRRLVTVSEALSSEQLVAASTADVDGPRGGPSRILSIRALAQQLSNRVDARTASEMDRLIDQLEKQIAPKNDQSTA